MSFAALCFWLVGSHWTQPFPYFKPDQLGPAPPHWKATECAVDDGKCIDAHDDHALTLAIMTRDVKTCWSAVDPGRCADIVRMTLGTFSKH